MAATFSLTLTLIAFICMAMAAADVSAVGREPASAAMKKKLQGGGGRNIDHPAFAAEKMRFYILSKAQTPPSGPSKKHNRKLQFTTGAGEDAGFHVVLADQRTVFPAISAKQKHYKDIYCGKAHTIIIHHPQCHLPKINLN